MTALLHIPVGDERKIVGCLARLNSAYDGEVIAAARAAARLLQPFGVRIEEIAIAAFDAPKAVGQVPALVEQELHQEDARWCLERACWSVPEQAFLERLASAQSISRLQFDWLADLLKRRLNVA